jgi:hypothetical protein
MHRPVFLFETQTHRIVQRIIEALERKQYSSAAFLNINQAFDKVWHTAQVKTTSPFELFPYPKILPVKQTFSRQNWKRLYRTLSR